MDGKFHIHGKPEGCRELLCSQLVMTMTLMTNILNEQKLLYMCATETDKDVIKFKYSF